MSPFWKKKKSIDEIEQEQELVTAEVDLARQKALLAELDKHYGKESWKLFSKNGLRSGINWSEVKFRLGSKK